MPSVILTAVLILFSSALFAEQIAPRKLKCATTHYPPYTIFTSERELPTGLDMNIMLRLAQHFSWSLSVDNLPWQRVKKMLETDTYDCFFSMGDFDYRHKHAIYTATPMHVTRYAVFRLKENQHKPITSYATIRGIEPPEVMIDAYNLSTLPKINTNDNETLVELLQRNRVDAIITNSQVGMYELSLHDRIDAISVEEFKGYELPTYLVFSKQASNIDVNAVNEWLSQYSEERQVH